MPHAALRGATAAASFVPDNPDDSRAEQDARERYMAGQSVMKAGLTRDPKEVNAIIFKASAGSKYHKNQLKRQAELEQRIAQLLKIKDERLKTSNLQLLESKANEMISELEATRDLSQYIVHVDMDAFYANVEVKRDPSLQGKAFGVGGGVLTTASYEARKYGCRSGMAGHVAKALCPHLIFVPCNFALYSEASNAVRQVLLKYDENLSMAGMDEGYLNITPYMHERSLSASEAVEELRAEVFKETGLTISAGIAPNTMLAKICSDRNKPNGQFELEFEGAAIRAFMRDLPIRTIPGIGKVHERVLQSMGVVTCGDIFKQRAVINAMDHWLGLRHLLMAYLGLGRNVVTPGRREERKSVGCERTFREKKDDKDILTTLEEIANELEKDMGRTKFAGKTITVKYKLHSYEVYTRARTVSRYVSTAAEILPVARELLIKELPLHLRLLGIRMTNLKDLEAPEKGIKKAGVVFELCNDKTDGPKCNSSLGDMPDAKRKRARSTSHYEDDERKLEIYLSDDDAEGQDVDQPPPPSSGRTADGLLVCPICWKTLKRGSDNAALNQHVDMCLNAEVIPDDDSADEVISIAPPLTEVEVKPVQASLKTPRNAFDVMMHRGPQSKRKRR